MLICYCPPCAETNWFNLADNIACHHLLNQCKKSTTKSVQDGRDAQHRLENATDHLQDNKLFGCEHLIIDFEIVYRRIESLHSVECWSFQSNFADNFQFLFLVENESKLCGFLPFQEISGWFRRSRACGHKLHSVAYWSVLWPILIFQFRTKIR